MRVWGNYTIQTIQSPPNRGRLNATVAITHEALTLMQAIEL
jgi:hypothetical protein